LKSWINKRPPDAPECQIHIDVTVPETTLAERSRSQNPARTPLRLRSGDGYHIDLSPSFERG